MTRRDNPFLKALGVILLIAFAPLWLHLSQLPGNFGDIYGYHYPLRHLVSSTLHAGRLPLWNPYIFAGTPLAANPQAVLFYPLSLLHYFLPLSWAFNIDVILHSALAVFGAYLLLRKWGLDSRGAWMLSLCYGFSPFLITRISQGVPTLLAALSWAPWTWLGLLSSSAPLLGGTLALQILSGHAQFSFINLAFIGLWSIWKRPAKWRFLAASGLWTAGLTAVQVIPTLEFLNRSIRAHWDTLFSTGYSLKPTFLLTLIHPNVFGNPRQLRFPMLPSEFFEMLPNYIGLIPLGLACFALWRSRQGRLLWALVAVGIFFSLGNHNPFYIPMQKILRLDFFRIPARFSFFVIWGLWLAAAVGWRSLGPKISLRWKWLILLAAVVDILSWSTPWIYSESPVWFLSSNPRVLEILKTDDMSRLATSPLVPAPNKSMLYRNFNVTGYEAFYLAPIAAYTAQSEGVPAADGSRTYVRRIDTPEMSRLSVRHYVSLEETSIHPKTSRLVFSEGPVSIYENSQAMPLVQTRDVHDFWKMESPEHWNVLLRQKSPVTFSQAHYPGWRAWVNGQSVHVTDQNGIFPSIDSSEFEKIITNETDPWILHFRFIPKLWFLSLWMTLAALLAWACNVTMIVVNKVKLS